ncbi:hypothetical protein BKG61_23640 [Mycobacterium syngnathidarum]|uniref:Uncharacterized protein n=1 Tax=Mycobacterium syngnathidarum TaxID=1908205 RepID=A0A1S1JS33_9MYCO|nr:hypothetical protein BKG61_23640 [Mycobacterium syngnathidarum]
MPSDQSAIVDRTLSGIDDSASRCASIAPVSSSGLPGPCCAPPLLLIVTPGANSRVDDVLPDRFARTGFFPGFLTASLPAPPTDDPPVLDAEPWSDALVAVDPVEDSPTELDVDELDVDDSDEDEDDPVVSAAATP